MIQKAKRPGPATYWNAERPILKAYLKQCAGCEEVKDKKDGFYKNAPAADGRQSRCKQCMKEAATP